VNQGHFSPALGAATGWGPLRAIHWKGFTAKPFKKRDAGEEQHACWKAPTKPNLYGHNQPPRKSEMPPIGAGLGGPAHHQASGKPGMHHRRLQYGLGHQVPVAIKAIGIRNDSRLDLAAAMDETRERRLLVDADDPSNPSSNSYLRSE